jgi:hypothetical protein
MAVTTQQLDAFHRFGAEKLQNGETELSWDELFILWESRNNRTEVNSAIREGLADVDAGRFESSDKVLADLRDEFGITE